MSSENPSGADNQQETKRCVVLNPDWIVGFVDGEGCFSVSIHASPVGRLNNGWQLQAAFQVYQHKDNVTVLEELAAYFGVGRISSKGPNSNVMTYSVFGLKALQEVIIPFFEQHPLRIKRRDFETFAVIVRAMRTKEHLTSSGFERLVTLAFGMNANGKQRARTLDMILEGSSETKREASFEKNE
jgi:hypothetical protein